MLLPQLRAFQGLTKEGLAREAGLDPSSISRYEKGQPMPRKRYEQYVEAAGLPLELVEACNRPAARVGLAALTHFSADMFTDLDSTVFALDTALADVRRAALAGLLVEMGGFSVAEASEEAQTWRFVEQLCHESADLAASEAEDALKLAEAVLGAAERAPGKGERRNVLEGYTWIFLGNARRVAGNLPGAEAAFVQAQALQSAWTGPTPIPLAAWRLPDMKASLRRHQGRFAEALELHDQALNLAPPQAAGRVLLKKAVTFEHQGAPERALATLDEAEMRGGREPRFLFGVSFNRIVNLSHLDRYEEAAHLLPAVEAMAADSGRQLDQIRVLWLKSKVEAGFGRRAEAVALLDRVRRELLDRKIAFDTALATLELALYYLEEGRSVEVAVIAADLAEVFAAQRVVRETLASAKLFCDAARQEAVTAERVRRWLQELRRAG